MDETIHVSPKTFSWYPGSNHTLSIPSPQPGAAGIRQVFSSWSDGGAQDHIITAPSLPTTFSASLMSQYSLGVELSPSNGGAVTPSGTAWFNKGDVANVAAQANPGFSFTGWSGALSGPSNSGTVSMTGPKKLKAKFKQVKYSLKTSVSPSQSGSVAKSPSKSKYVYGETVTLTAKPKAGYVFTGWSGSATGLENPIALSITGNLSATASFAKEESRQ